MTTLSNRNLGSATRRPRRPPEGPGIVHLGLGNFHRAHQAVYTAAALEAEPGSWGIIGVANRSHRVVDPMTAQDGLYSVLTLTPEGFAAEIIGVHEDAFVGAEQPDRVVEHLADERIRVVTITVTENGYTYAASGGGLDLSQPIVVKDLEGGPPTTTIGQLARGLQRRFRGSGAPLSIVSCDNLSDNGGLTRLLVIDFLQRSADAEVEEQLAWMDANVAFPSTMVDRIVPATETHHRSTAARLLGVDDACPVPAEPFSMWVLEDRFAAGRPRWEHGGALFTDDVGAYELLKLRLLNASNSMLAYLGLLTGRRYIWESLQDVAIAGVVDRLMRQEMLPTLRVPEAVDVERYISELFERFGNRSVGHRTSQVGSDGSVKLPIRITEPVHHHLRVHGRPPPAIALLVAAFIRCLASPDAYDHQATGRPEDAKTAAMAELGRKHATSRHLVRAVFETGGIFPASLLEAPSFIDAVVEAHEVLACGDVERATAGVTG